MEQVNILEFTLPIGLFPRKRRLRLTPDFLEYENGNLESGRFTRVYKEDILDIKRGMGWILWYRFYVGCDFRIDIKTKESGILNIRFASYFGKNETYINAYAAIVDWMWQYYLRDVVAANVRELHHTGSIELGGVRLSREGLCLDTDGSLIYWEDIAVQEYEDYFALYNQNKPEQNIRVEFDAWESDVLMQVVKSLKKGVS